MLGGDWMGTLKVSSEEPVPRTCCLPQEAHGAVGLDLGTTNLTLEQVCGKQLGEGVRVSLALD